MLDSTLLFVAILFVSATLVYSCGCFNSERSSSLHSLDQPFADHLSLTRSGLASRSFSPRSQEIVAQFNIERDSCGNHDCALFQPELHFMSNKFVESWDRMQEDIKEVVDGCNKDTCEEMQKCVWRHFGLALHTLQDFYAHTTWAYATDKEDWKDQLKEDLILAFKSSEENPFENPSDDFEPCPNSVFVVDNVKQPASSFASFPACVMGECSSGECVDLVCSNGQCRHGVFDSDPSLRGIAFDSRKPEWVDDALYEDVYESAGKSTEQATMEVIKRLAKKSVPEGFPGWIETRDTLLEEDYACQRDHDVVDGEGKLPDVRWWWGVVFSGVA